METVAKLLSRPFVTELTDAAPNAEVTCQTIETSDLIIDVISDKGCTILVYPLPNPDSAAYIGKASATVTIPDLGGSERIRYSTIAAAAAKVVVAKTESGSTAGFCLTVRGV